MRADQSGHSRRRQSLHARRDLGGGPIRFQRPQLPPQADVDRYFRLARDRRWFSNEGPCHRLLSERLTKSTGEGSVVLVANATLGLMLALRALIGERPTGSRVIVPSFTFPATAQAIAWNGLRPLWVDVEEAGWHVDPAALRATLEAHGSDVVAVLACSTFGTAPSSDQSSAWRAACAEAGVPLLVDSAPGFGSVDERGTPLGLQGDAEVFSFHATKPFAIGEGGAITTRDRELAERLAAMTNFGFDEDHTVTTRFAFNAKMSELHAATALALLDRFDEVLQARRGLAGRLRDLLGDTDYRVQAGSEGSSWQFVPVLAPSAAVREAVLARAGELEIEIRAYHEPLHTMPVFEQRDTTRTLPVTDDLARRALSLPLANDLSDHDLTRIADLLLSTAASHAEELTA